jgi:hypothetical protein
MELLNQARLAQARLADNQYYLAIALPRSFPAPDQHRNFFLATNKWREMTLACSASSTTRSDEAEYSHRLWHALEFMAAAFLGDKETSDLTLHPRRHNDRTRLGQRLRPRGDIGHIAEYLARRVDDHWPQVDGDACSERWPADVLVLAVKVGERPLDRECRPHRPLRVVLLRHRIAEQRHQPVAELLGDFAAQLGYRR